MKPAAWSVAVAWSSGLPTTLGTATGAGPFETLIRTELPTTSFVPAFGSCAVTWFAGVFELTPCTSGFRCSAFSWLTASDSCWPTSVGTATFGFPVEIQIVTGLPFWILLPSVGSCL